MKYRRWAALTAITILAGPASPALGADAEKRPERTVRETPYSNTTVAREREARKIEKALDRDRRPDHYVFRDRRRPE